MQWNFGQGSLQPILARFRSKFSDTELTEQLARLMPVFGKQLFARSCTAKPIEQACITFLKTQYMRDGALQPAFKAETDRLFESDVMRQIQVDYFARSLTTILDDLSRIFHTAQPEAWMVAWAMDLKTQQGRFPSDNSIARVRKDLMTLELPQRKVKLFGIVSWYKATCDIGYSSGVKEDCTYNVSTWNGLIANQYPPSEREETIHFTYAVSHTATGQDGDYQADAFQRRAAIAFGKGSVHGTRVDFSEY